MPKFVKTQERGIKKTKFMDEDLEDSEEEYQDKYVDNSESGGVGKDLQMLKTADKYFPDTHKEKNLRACLDCHLVQSQS